MNRDIPKAFTGGTHEPCDTCQRMPSEPDGSDGARVEFTRPPRSICITCLTAANEAIKNVVAVVIDANEAAKNIEPRQQ